MREAVIIWMKRAVIIVLGFMILVTAWLSAVTAYRVGFLEGKLHAEEAALIKDPHHIGVNKLFYTIRLDTEPLTWHTAEQLGVVLIRDNPWENYWIYVVSEQTDRALAWMTHAAEENYVLPVVKHGDEFYAIGFYWVDYGWGRTVQSIVIVPLLLLAIGWGIFTIVAYISCSQRTPLKQE